MAASGCALFTGPPGEAPPVPGRYKQVSPGCPKIAGPLRGPGHPRVFISEDKLAYYVLQATKMLVGSLV